MKKPKATWEPAAYDHATVIAVKALAAGNASEGQQQAALRWIIEAAAGTYDVSYRPDVHGGDRDTAFHEGRRFVGLTLVKLVNMDGRVLDAKRKTDG